MSGQSYKDKSLKVSKRYKTKAFFKYLSTIRFFLIPTAQGRVKWLKKKNKFALLGEHVHYQPREYPADADRIKIHNNVAIAAGVKFYPHDIIHWVFNGVVGKREFAEWRGCIEIYENVFIGAGAIILGDVQIGPNSIIGGGAVVVKDVPAGVIVAGNPAKVVGKFDDLMDKRKRYSMSHGIKADNDKLWEEFYSKRNNKND